jgi:hypothetical protein
VVGSVGIRVALLNQRRQLNAQMFIEFSARFQELLRMFPTDAWLANVNPSRHLPPQSQDVRDYSIGCRCLSSSPGDVLLTERLTQFSA